MANKARWSVLFPLVPERVPAQVTTGITNVKQKKSTNLPLLWLGVKHGGDKRDFFTRKKTAIVASLTCIFCECEYVVFWTPMLWNICSAICMCSLHCIASLVDSYTEKPLTWSLLCLLKNFINSSWHANRDMIFLLALNMHGLAITTPRQKLYRLNQLWHYMVSLTLS